VITDAELERIVATVATAVDQATAALGSTTAR
jgi:hypothetical protein